MVDASLVAAIFNDFFALYKGTGTAGIAGLYVKYRDNSVLYSLMTSLNDTAKIPSEQALFRMYEIYKENRERVLNDQDWEWIAIQMRALNEEYNENKWCQAVMLALVELLEESDKSCTEQKKGQRQSKTKDLRRKRIAMR